MDASHSPTAHPINLDAARSAARAHAHLLIPARCRGSAELREEAEQELLVRVLVATPRFDPRRGAYSTFADRVARNAARNHLAARMSLKRAGQELPLDDGLLEAPEVDHALVRDVRRVLLEVLDSEDRALCIALVDHGTRTDAAKACRLSRATANRRLDAIRETFITAGLDAYVRGAA